MVLLIVGSSPSSILFLSVKGNVFPKNIFEVQQYSHTMSPCHVLSSCIQVRYSVM